MDKNPPKLAVLDPAQLIRIEAVHRGFLYQHLYAAQCLLTASTVGATSIAIEGDEDVEIQLGGKRIYIQIKHRERPLAWNDIEGATARFDDLRQAHARGDRDGTPEFVVVANSAPNGPLLERIGKDDWPADIKIDWPGAEQTGHGHPTPRPTLLDAVEFTRDLAGKLPFGVLTPETLVWKLAGVVMLAATGERASINHVFETQTLPELFEQLILQLQDLPTPPSPYRVQRGEPDLTSGRRVRIIVGYSGAGKTSWLAQAAQQAPDPLVYLDVSEIPGPGLANAVAREVAARIFGGGNKLGQVLLPGASGLEILQALSRRISDAGLAVSVALDNAHRIPSDNVTAVVRAAQAVQFFLLCRPEGETAAIEAMLEAPREELSGWDPDTVAAAAHDIGCKGDAADCQRLIDLTGGLPLYVLNALAITQGDYEGNLKHFTEDLARTTHSRETAQEHILGKVFAGLPKVVADVADLLSLCDAPLTREEAAEYVAAADGLDNAAVLRALRSLTGQGLIQGFAGDKIKVHDAARVVGKGRLALLGAAEIIKRQRELRAVILKNLRKDWSPLKLSSFLRLSADVGDVELLAEMATDELFHEMGVWPEVEPFLRLAADDESLPADQRIKVLDGLVFAYLKADSENVEPLLAKMDELIAINKLGADETLRVGMKRMNALAKNGDRAGVETLKKSLATTVANASPAHRRVLNYNVAVAELMLGDSSAAIRRIRPLIKEYYDLIGLTPEQVMGKNAPQLRPLLKNPDSSTDDLKHLADSLDVLAKATDKEGGMAPMARIHALKFYDLAQAPESLFRVGMDLVDEFLSRNDFEGALQTIETNLLPQLQRYRVAAYVIPVRSQYAVVLAYNGKFDDADKEMARLRPYQAGLDDRGQQELANQQRLIERLRHTGAPIGWRPAPGLLDKIATQIQAGDLSALWRPAGANNAVAKVGRNDTCPCGSGKKFKKCHGR